MNAGPARARSARTAAGIAALGIAADEAAEFLRTLAHAGRLRIVCALMDGEVAASRLARQAHLAAPALSQQATILESAGLIARRREGRSVLYRLSSQEARALALLLVGLFCGAPRKAGRTQAGRKTRQRH